MKCEQELEDFLAQYIKSSRQGKTISQKEPGNEEVQHVASYLQQAQSLGKQYASRYIKQQPKEAVIGADIVPGLVDRAKNLIGRALSWAKDLFTSKVEALGDDASEDDIQAAIDDVSVDVAENLGLTEIQDVIETEVLDEFNQAGVTQIEWIASPGACQLCLDNAAASPININGEWPSGDTVPPAHSRCRCHTIPAS